MNFNYIGDPDRKYRKAMAETGSRAVIWVGIISFIFLIFAFVFFKASKNSEVFFDSNTEQVVTEQNNDLETVQKYEFTTDENHY